MLCTTSLVFFNVVPMLSYFKGHTLKTGLLISFIHEEELPMT